MGWLTLPKAIDTMNHVCHNDVVMDPLSITILHLRPRLDSLWLVSFEED